ncbi:hypothetical protein [Deinococcus radiophilus]|uniref:Uncharacterized protein n=1 Tax=Deinococcus radiophilus TaxID=32062 RepID=A0A431W614_9DEIO|nr:hypothetical protein [Deinococcus radiophilus]RTR30856.1 hypothetical protein EJ104_00980 [Deinococcus radiophilus]UFA49437.1 hypothetical protein LMT64_05850 [Deinococcus radiophilus]
MTDPGDRATAPSNMDPETGRPDSEAQPTVPEVGEEGSKALLKENEKDQAQKAADFPDPTAL